MNIISLVPHMLPFSSIDFPDNWQKSASCALGKQGRNF